MSKIYKNRGSILVFTAAFYFIISGLLEESIFSDDKAPGEIEKSFLLQFKIPRRLLFCGEHVPLERRDVWERLDREFLFTLSREAQIIMWLKRSKRYFPLIEERLHYYRLPEDLKYLAVAESDLYIYALSPKGAAGIWQFMEQTGKNFGLKNHKLLDERYSFSKSTDAALTYLKSLYEKFGTWTLAVAAYNCGEQRVKREIREQGVSDFFDLDLPQETEEYLFRIMAIKIILSEPERFGFILDKEDYYTVLDVVPVAINLPGLVHIRIIAKAAKTTFKVIKELNPQLKGYYLSQSKKAILIPRKGVDGFNERLKSLLDKASKRKRMVYRVKYGDTLSEIALRLEISMRRLQKWNNLKRPDSIYPGEKIIYFRPIWE